MCGRVRGDRTVALAAIESLRRVKTSPFVLTVARRGGRLSLPAVDGLAALRRGRGGGRGVTLVGSGGRGVSGGGAGLGGTAADRSNDGRERWRVRGAARSG